MPTPPIALDPDYETARSVSQLVALTRREQPDPLIVSDRLCEERRADDRQVIARKGRCSSQLS